jgi:hypothetical protein
MIAFLGLVSGKSAELHECESEAWGLRRVVPFDGPLLEQLNIPRPRTVADVLTIEEVRRHPHAAQPDLLQAARRR